MAKRIAIVEDEAAIRDNYAEAFRREGYAVDAYASRAPALEAFAARLPDLVVIDINLKDDVEGGFELCRDLRARSADLPIIFLHNVTGYMVGAEYEQGGIIKAGAKLINAVSNSTVPAITIMIGASQAGGCSCKPCISSAR